MQQLIAEDVISGSGLSFYTNYADCWRGANENGASNKEVIWWVDYSDVLENNIMPKRLKLDARRAAADLVADDSKKCCKYNGRKCFTSDVCGSMEQCTRTDYGI